MGAGRDQGESGVDGEERGGQAENKAPAWRLRPHSPLPCLTPLPQHELKSALATVLLAEAPSLDMEPSPQPPSADAPPPAPTTPGASPRVRGLAVVWTVADEAQLLEVAVHPAWRRQGVGAALVAAVLARAPAGGTIVLEVAASNTAARALYASYGFVETGRRKRYYRDGGDALLLACKVGG